MKTSELQGAALDWAVAKCEGHEAHVYGGVVRTTMCGVFGPELNYSTDWSQAGPIIEREQITIGADGEGWCAGKPWDSEWMSGFIQRGPTPLIAAMRCFVASRLGETVDVPEELI